MITPALTLGPRLNLIFHFFSIPFPLRFIWGFNYVFITNTCISDEDGQEHLLHCEDVHFHSYLFYICCNEHSSIVYPLVKICIFLHLLLEFMLVLWHIMNMAYKKVDWSVISKIVTTYKVTRKNIRRRLVVYIFLNIFNIMAKCWTAVVNFYLL